MILGLGLYAGGLLTVPVSTTWRWLGLVIELLVFRVTWLHSGRGFDKDSGFSADLEPGSGLFVICTQG